jgi:glycosyltransferase involved in cell wall biosynthesis
MKIAIVSDTSNRQMNGVATSVRALYEELREKGKRVIVVDADKVKGIDLSRWSPELHLAHPIRAKGYCYRMLDKFGPDHVHVSTEGPMGHYGLKWANENGIRSSSCSHTDWAKVMEKIIPLVGNLLGKYILSRSESADVRFFRNGKAAFAWERKTGRNAHVLKGGVDKCFRYRNSNRKNCLLWAGRISKDKNLEDIRMIAENGHRVVIAGAGPMVGSNLLAHKNIEYLGRLSKWALSDSMNKYKSFLFTSKTDTLGLVCLESACCGMPTIAYENDATSESVINGKTGFKGDNLLELLEISNKIDESECFDFAIKEWGFGAMANSFLKGIQKN